MARLPSPRRLAANAVHIWRIPLARTQEVEPQVRPLLSADETARAQRFRFERHRAAFTCTRAALRALLGRYLDVPPEALRFGYGESGKPHLAAGNSHPRLSFNLSHAEGLALVAIATGIEVGIDLEAIRSIPERASIAASHFSGMERKLFHPERTDRAFFGCWTRKEAVLKGIGTGLMRPLHTFGIVPEQGRSESFRIVGDLQDAGRWRVWSFTPGPAYVAAVALAEGDMNQVFFDWDWQGWLR